MCSIPRSCLSSADNYSRYVILSQLRKALGGESHDLPLQSQGPTGRVSLDRQDLGNVKVIRLLVS